MATLQLRRGKAANLPILAQGEPAMTTDEGNEGLYLGTGKENLKVHMARDPNGYVGVSGDDHMKGNLVIEKAIPGVDLVIPDSERAATLMKNANAELDFGTELVDYSDYDNYTKLTMSHANDKLTMTRVVNGGVEEQVDILHSGMKPEVIPMADDYVALNASDYGLIIDARETAGDDKTARRLVLRNSGTELRHTLGIVDALDGGASGYSVYGSHNKRTKFYTGNGGKQDIDLESLGDVCMVTWDSGMAFVSAVGMLYMSASTGPLFKQEIAVYTRGALRLATSSYINVSGTDYTVTVL